MGFFRRGPSLYARALWALQAQAQMIQSLHMELLRVDLEHARHDRDLIEQFLIALDEPSGEVREAMILGLRDLQDHVARLEEHV